MSLPFVGPGPGRGGGGNALWLGPRSLFFFFTYFTFADAAATRSPRKEHVQVPTGRRPVLPPDVSREHAGYGWVEDMEYPITGSAPNASWPRKIAQILAGPGPASSRGQDHLVLAGKAARPPECGLSSNRQRPKLLVTNGPKPEPRSIAASDRGGQLGRKKPSTNRA